MPLGITVRRIPLRAGIGAAVCASALLAVGLATGAEQTVAAPDQVTRKARLRGGVDPNVEAGTDVNVRARPPGRGAAGPKSSGRLPCAITFDNHTDLFTKTYIDGHYSGTISPSGTLSASALPGSTVLYARAEYDDGSADAWGPVRVNCQAKYVWRLVD